MSKPVISIENLSKSYRLGQIGTGTLTNDLKVWWARTRGKPNPLLRIGQTDHGNQDGETLWALKDVSFQVEQGEVLGIIGRNGAGKSTLLKILSRVTAPTSGEIKVKGRIASLLEVGTGFHPDLTGRENIYLNGAILGMIKGEIRRKFDEIVAFAEIEKFVDTPVKRYSSGMYVRLAFAVAAHLDSEILLVDEVLAVGDAEFQKKCLGKMGDVASKEGRTVLFVSHNMASIEVLCNRILLLQKGFTFFNGEVRKGIDLYYGKQITNLKNIDISQYRHCNYNTDIQIISIRVLDKNNQPQNKFEINSEVVIEISVYSKNTLNYPSIGIGINTSRGIRVCTLSTRFQSPTFSKIRGFSKVYCSCSMDDFMPGQYNLKITFGDYAIDYDTITDFPGFEIVNGDYFGTGKLPHPDQGIILKTAEWKSI